MERLRANPRRLALTIAAILLGGACVARSGGVDKPCVWRIISTRPAGLQDTAFVDRHPLLAEPEDMRDAPGPGSLRLVNRKSANGKWPLYLVNPATRESTLLVEQASTPRLSPDGRYVVFSLWKSSERPWNLVIVDRKTRKRIEPPMGGCVSSYRRWSPDGKWLAVQDNPCKVSRRRLCLVSVPSGRVRWIDSLAVFADYEFGWSPDSKHLAVMRPEAIDESTDEPMSADLWIFSNAGRTRCLLEATPEYVEHAPMWVTDSTLLVDRYKRDGTQFTTEDRILLRVKGGRP